jgi:hypothetical protein
MRTAVFDTIKSLHPFFFSLREIQEKVSLDIKIPVHWKNNYEEDTDVQFKVQDKNEKNMLLSLISLATKEGYDAVFNVAKKIIRSNQEEEEKIKLFNDKVEELRKFFLDSPLDKLKEISFIKNNVRDKKSTGEIELGNGEGSGDN